MEHTFSKYVENKEFSGKVNSFLENLSTNRGILKYYAHYEDKFNDDISAELAATLFSYGERNFYEGVQYTIKSYAEPVFHALRLVYSMDSKKIQDSFDPLHNIMSIFKDTESTAGRSGQDIFRTADKQYIIKMMTKEEKEVFVDMSVDYAGHLVDNKRTLIAKIFGIYSVRIDKKQKFYLMIIENLDPFEDDYVLFKYDRKFSKKNRFALKSQMEVDKYKSVLMRDIPEIKELFIDH